MASSFPSLEGKYEVLEKLHEGGMGAVYKVRHRLLDEVRVIKVMRRQYEGDEGLRARFLREAQMAVKLRHPHIAQMFDFAFDESGRGFIVMEYVEGISLQQLLERIGAPSLGLSLDLARQTLAAVGFLHRRGIVHRDISPDNIMATRDDLGQTLVKLIDLGIAKVMEASTGLTGTGTFLGKLRYASPEQFGISGGTIDPRTDIYSFGVVLYELLTGTHPLPGESPHEIIAGHLVKPPIDFAVSDPDGRVPADLRGVVLRAMAKRPEDRFSTAAELDRALAAVQVRFPPRGDELAEALLQGTEPTAKIRVPPGSTQERINAQFGLGATPRPIPLVASDAGAGAPETQAFPNEGEAVPTGSVPPTPPGTGAAAVPSPAAPPTPTAPSTTGAGVPSAVGTQPTVIMGEPLPPPPVPQVPGGGMRPRRSTWPWLAAAGGLVVVTLAAGLAILHRRGPTAGEEPFTPASATAVPSAEPELGPTPPVSPTAGPVGAAIGAGDFDKAFAAGNVAQIRTLLAGLSRSDRAAIERSTEGQRMLDNAHRVAEADAALAKATKRQDWLAAVQYASTLVSLVPASRDASRAREAAAASLEREADALINNGQGEAAVGKLHALQRVWPDRPGLDSRLASARSAHEADQRFAAAMTAAEEAEKQRRPEEGLDALAGVTPDSRWQERFATARTRLEGQLAALDKAAPVIRLKPGFKLEYSRGKPVTVEFLVTDDYRVKNVTVMARKEGMTEYQSVPAKAVAGDQYTVEITPEFHANKTVELYIVATDYSGHVAKLGTAEQPLVLKKRFLFF